MLDARSLSKRFGATLAVDGVSLAVAPGESVGLLGPNGAGKTTTISMLSGLLAPDQGQVLIDGQPLRSDTDPRKQRLGLVPQDLAVYEELSAEQNLHIFGALYGLHGKALARATDSALEVVKLSDRRRDRVGDFSGGMKRRINLAAALLHAPTLIILDEPTVGVDPQSRNAIFENIETLKAQGCAILYTTHYMEEAERLCDRIVIIDQGRVIADAPLSELYRHLPAQSALQLELAAPPPPGVPEALKGLPAVRAVTLRSEKVLVVELQSFEAVAAVLAVVSGAGSQVVHLETSRPSLEAVFLGLTGKRLRDA